MTDATKTQLGVIARHSVLELILTTLLLFGVTTIVRFVVGPSWISRAVPGIHMELLLVGVAVGLLLAVLIISRPCKLRRGHINPALSLAILRVPAFSRCACAPR